MKPVASNDRNPTHEPHPEEAALFARPSRRMAAGTTSLVAVLRDARILRQVLRSALLRARLQDVNRCDSYYRNAVLKLPLRGELHVGRIEAQLDILLGAEISGRHGDADGVLRFDVLTEQIVLEAERTYEIHDFRQIGLRREREGVLGGVEHPRGF